MFIFLYCLAFYSKKHLKIKMSIKSISKDDYNYRKSLVKEIFIFSSFVIFNTVVDMLNKSLDKILLGFYNADSVSTYQLASTIPSYLISITSIVTIVNTQKINDAYYNGNGLADLNKVYLSTSKIQTIITFLLVGGYLAVGREFVVLWLDESHIQVYLISSILMCLYSLTCSNALGVVARRTLNCHGKACIIYLSIVISNVLLSIVFINLMPKNDAIWGCILGTMITYLIGHYFVMQLYDYKNTKLEIPGFFKTYFIYLICTFAICVIINRLFEIIEVTNVVFLFVFKGVSFIVLYLLVIFAIDKKIMANFTSKLFIGLNYLKHKSKK